MQDFTWLSVAVGLVVPLLLGWFRFRMRPFYRRASEATRSSPAAKAKLLTIATIDQVAVLGALILFPELLRWHFKAPTLFSFVTGYRTCFMYYIAGVALTGIPISVWLSNNRARERERVLCDET